MKKFIVNDCFFDEIDSEIKAYLLGFFAADGNVENSTNRLCVNIQDEDIYICNLFKDYLSPDSTIQYKSGKGIRKDQVCWRISSKQIKEALNTFGIVSNKTFKEISFKSIPLGLKRHFIRGYFDGDGCFYHNPNLRNKCCVSFTNGTKGILLEIKDYFLDLNVKFKLEEKVSIVGRKYYVLVLYNLIEAKLFSNIIYTNSNFYLARKYNKFNQVNTEQIRTFKRV